MSLINEALRKARQEAAEQQEQERGGKRDTYRPPRAHLPEQSRLGLGLFLGAGLGLLVAMAAGIAIWLAMDRNPDTPATQDVLAQSTAAPSTAPPEQTPAVAKTQSPPSPEPPQTEPTKAIEPAPAQKPTEPAPSTSHPAPSAPEPATPTRPAEPVATQPPPAEPAPPTTRESTEVVAATDQAVTRLPEPAQPEDELPKLIEPPETIGQVGDSTFVLEAELGGKTVTLDFIVWNPSAPFAQINGKQVKVGQLVAGLLVENIERDRVTLKSTEGRIVLRVR